MDNKIKIRDYINQNLIIFDSDIEFNDEDDIFELGFVDSMFAMKLINFIEQEFKITIDNEDIDIRNFNSLANIEKLIKRKNQE